MQPPETAPTQTAAEPDESTGPVAGRPHDADGAFGRWINALIAFSLRHRIAVVGTTLLVAAAGVWAFATLNTDAFPDLTGC